MQAIGFFSRARFQARYRHQPGAHQPRVWPSLRVMLRELTGLVALIVLISAGLTGLSSI